MEPTTVQQRRRSSSSRRRVGKTGPYKIAVIFFYVGYPVVLYNITKQYLSTINNTIPSYR
jgi:hypothetical protein